MKSFRSVCSGVTTWSCIVHIHKHCCFDNCGPVYKNSHLSQSVQTICSKSVTKAPKSMYFQTPSRNIFHDLSLFLMLMVTYNVHVLSPLAYCTSCTAQVNNYFVTLWTMFTPRLTAIECKRIIPCPCTV